ncbi:MAG: hypothetical protein EOO24_41510 [Comamonadaceae bacterium]|nr:MAG: hypothetical protein EOO24_41510 [Comamonadaceae bacterium]
MPTPLPALPRAGRPCRAVALALGVGCCAASMAQAPTPAPAQDQPLGAPSRPADLTKPLGEDPYGGVVVNQTITLVGHEFYRSFVAAWRERPGSDRYTLTVGERPTAQLGSQVWVDYGRRRVFQTFLPPARARVSGFGERAAALTYENVVQSDAQRLLFKDPDLGPDEI